jgi:hypothetical protein
MADLLETAAKAFPTVSGDQNHLLAVGEEGITLCQLVVQGFIAQTRSRTQNSASINRIAGYRNPIVGDIFPQQVLP